MSRLQLGMAAFVLGPAALAIGFIFQMDWATSTWPFETSRLCLRDELGLPRGAAASP